MALSGSTNFEPNVTEFIEEAFERCGIELRTGYDLRTAKRSINIMLAEWANRGLNQWTIEQTTQTVTEGTNSYSLNSNVIDILDMVVRRTTNSVNTDTNMSRISRSEYLNIPNKDTKARPNQFFFDKQTTPAIKVYPTPENSTDILVFNKLVRMDDADTATNTMDLPFRFYPCFAAGLAYYISIKRAPQRTAELKAIYEEEFRRAADQDEDKASFRLRPYLRNV
ncbi:MAG: hypothetical protein CBC64_005935 [Gammaproteobacteria bacterium TMED104]|jgi:hypothetical protein|nr:MAG: hypothetical protein CBC64_005935 [Gammaproteobacteria bacterium TMED104]|tara:strand:+ start:9128 stop:9799 length:672 start_codon:yes stop_codon:yes gene_type:complete